MVIAVHHAPIQVNVLQQARPVRETSIGVRPVYAIRADVQRLLRRFGNQSPLGIG